MHVLVISLPFDNVRRKKISEIMDALNIEYSFVDAIYGKHLSLDEKQKIPLTDFQRRENHTPTDGELGCTSSHIKAYKQFLQQGQDWVCILEDDAIIDQNFKKFISTVDENVLSKNSLYLLGGQDGLRYNRKVVLNLAKFKKIGGQKFGKVIFGHGYVLRACGYLINSDTAKRLISRFENNFFIIDEWAYLMRQGYFSDIYLASFVHHPEELSGSWLEKERKEIKSGKKKEKSFLRRKISSSYWNARRFILGLCWWK
ncbi:glycosyltransferase family 25 protein [Citrobacter sp. C348]|uniref:glycosyltransferase family 25 protein n=1 Tax=Citrobacter sp. C348 TaxID=3048143 RepID=UPI0039C1E9CF